MSRALTVTFNLSFAKPDVGSAIRAWAAADRPELGCEAEDGRLQAVGEEGEDGGGQPSVAVQGSQDVQGVYLHTGHAGCVPTHNGIGLAGCVPTHSGAGHAGCVPTHNGIGLAGCVPTHSGAGHAGCVPTHSGAGHAGCVPTHSGAGHTGCVPTHSGAAHRQQRMSSQCLNCR